MHNFRIIFVIFDAVILFLKKLAYLFLIML